MKKVLLGFVGLILLAVIGYFVDPNFQAQVNKFVPKQNQTPIAETQVEKTDITNIVSVQGNRLSDIKEHSAVTVSVQNPSKPFYSGEGLRAKGFNVDFMKALFAQSEFKSSNEIKVVASDVDTYEDVPKQLLSNKKVDIAIDGLTFNDQDLPGVVYTIPYVKDFGYSLIVAKGNVINSADDTAGMKIGILQGDPDVRSFVESAFPKAKIVELSDVADANGKWIVGHFNSKKVDAVVYDYPFAVSEVEDTDLQFAMTKIKGSDIQYRIGVRKEDKDLLVALNSAIRKVVESDAYSELLKSYFMSTNVATTRRASSGEVSYIVAKGDTLSIIAQTQLGDIKRFTDIQARNNLANPNFISVGQKLVIPTK